MLQGDLGGHEKAFVELDMFCRLLGRFCCSEPPVLISTKAYIYHPVGPVDLQYIISMIFGYDTIINSVQTCIGAVREHDATGGQYFTHFYVFLSFAYENNVLSVLGGCIFFSAWPRKVDPLIEVGETLQTFLMNSYQE